ncbi:FAD-dependent oxidoreductase [Lentilactobacillus sp. Marseille-Q4993]|uniref:NAD(P)/FAD-dependent oxidoreductase n=1 Tax=Lentilactobacillus sp. Marseille-Q4993 TaxID=3039492 RepID=UPI0024BC9D6F|nr:FAD-dependent oxidoreductase [Lentilactobacillus sp. Marseille-Q4993]
MQNIAIIGGGIIGATSAFYLANNNKVNVTLFDDDCGQATKAASGIISPWLSKRRNKRWFALAKRGADFYSELVRDAKLGKDVYQQTGTIVTRKEPEKLTELYALANERLQVTPAMQSVKLLTADEVKELIPILTNPEAGIFVAGGAKINGHELVATLISQAVNNGMHLSNSRVKLSNGFEVVENSNQQKFDKIVITPGAFLANLLEPIGFDVDIRPQKGQLIDLNIQSTVFDDMPVYMPEGESDIIPFTGHQLTIGATHENEAGFDLNPTELADKSLFASGQKSIANLSENEINRVRVGTRGYTSDFAPFFGAIEGQPNVLVAGGLGSSGLTTGPIIGKLLADMAVSGDYPDFDSFTKPVAQYVKMHHK